MRVIIECRKSELKLAKDLLSDFKQARRDFGGWVEAASAEIKIVGGRRNE